MTHKRRLSTAGYYIIGILIAVISLIPFGWLPVIVGGACLIAGFVLTLVFGGKKEVAAA